MVHCYNLGYDPSHKPRRATRSAWEGHGSDPRQNAHEGDLIGSKATESLRLIPSARPRTPGRTRKSRCGFFRHAPPQKLQPHRQSPSEIPRGKCNTPTHGRRSKQRPRRPGLPPFSSGNPQKLVSCYSCHIPNGRDRLPTTRRKDCIRSALLGFRRAALQGKGWGRHI
jgi:hypothetical protein